MKARQILYELWCALTHKCSKCGEHLACNDNEHEYGNWYCPNCDGNCEDGINITKTSDDTVTISKDRYEQLLRYEQEYISRQSMINSFIQNK